MKLRLFGYEERNIDVCCKLTLDMGCGASPALMEGWVIDRNLRLQVITKAGEFSETQFIISG